MKTDGLFDYRVVEIPASYGKPINLFFQGDEHFNSPNFAQKKWLEDLEDMRRACRERQTYFIKTGDVFEALSTSERHSFSNGGYHDSNRTRWENEYKKEIDDYVKQVDFMVGRTLAVFGGNHYFQFYDGTTSDMALASKIKAPYIGCSGYVVLILKIGNKTNAIRIFVHHGKSSGKRAGSAFTALEDAAGYFADADILVMGHDHKAGAMHLPSITIDHGQGDNWKIKENQRIIGRAGSYLKAYEPGKASYAVDAMYRPSTLGCLQIVLTPMRTQLGPRSGRKDERWVQMKAVI